MPNSTASPETLKARIEQFRDAVGDKCDSGTWLYPKNFETSFTAEELVAMLQDFGYTRIYCRITSEKELDEYFLALLVAAENAGIKTEIIIDLFSFYSRKGENTIWSNILPSSPNVTAMVQTIIDRFKHDSAYATLDGITIVVNPHRFTGKNLDFPKNVHFVWSESTYGIGLDNDEMMKISLNIIRNLPEMPAGLQLSIAIPDFYDTLVAEGKLSCGTIADFMKARNDNPKLIVICYGNVPTELKRDSEDELKLKEPSPRSVLLLVQLANHTSVRSGKIRRRDWNDFTKIIRFLREKAEKHTSFGGIISGPFGLVKIVQSEP